MMKKTPPQQVKMMVVTIEDLMPKQHLLRKITDKIDFTFIYEKAAPLYSSNGRPSVDPVMLVKTLLIGFLYGINSERRLEQEIQVNIAYKWFLGLDLDENPPDHSTMSQNRRRRFNESQIFREIFEEIVTTCYKAGLIEGKSLLTDSTHVKANATSSKYEMRQIQRELSSYTKELDRLADIETEELRQRGIKSQPKGRKSGPSVLRRFSNTDPDSGELNRPGKPLGFHYLSHTTSDAKHGLIVDVAVTGGDRSDISVYPERIRYIKEAFDFNIQEAAADSGYNKAIAHYMLAKENIKLYTPSLKERSRSKTEIDRNSMLYDEGGDCFVCPNSKHLTYSNVQRSEYGEVHKVYKTRATDCIGCAYYEKCIAPSKRQKVIMINILEPFVLKNKELTKTPRFKQLLRLRQIITEGNHSLQKKYHNLTFTYKKGLTKVLEHCLFSAMALNLKRLAKYS